MYKLGGAGVSKSPTLQTKLHYAKSEPDEQDLQNFVTGQLFSDDPMISPRLVFKQDRLKIEDR